MRASKTAGWSQRSTALVVAVVGLAAPPTRGGSIEATVTATSGTPIKDAVVYALPAAGSAPRGGETKVLVLQRDKQFVPYVSVVRTGSAVHFPNEDDVKHHIYSFSAAKKFELPLYAGTPAEPVVFDRAGVVTLGCNIHDWMIAYILVIDTPWFAVTDASGRATLKGLPAGNYQVEAWQPRLKGAPSTLGQKIAVAGGGTAATFKMNLKPEFRPRRGPTGSDEGYR